MLNEKFKEAIGILENQFNKNKIKWALVGSTNMALQGMNVEPRDLDVVVQKSYLEKIMEIFKEYNPSQIKELEPFIDKPAWEVKIKIKDVEIQVFTEEENGTYVKKLLEKKLIWVKLSDIKIPCFTLEAEIQAYVETNRKNKADLIREFLNSKNN